MGSVKSQGISTVHSKGILATARLGQPSNVQYLQGLLLEMKKYAPPQLKNKISAAVRPLMDILYNEHVLSMVDSSQGSKVFKDIKSCTITEHAFVEALKPEGHLNPFALHA
ncbi:hypothetical protein ACP70R_046347 [Stipagrostis hirtigluma subsp. patula]